MIMVNGYSIFLNYDCFLRWLEENLIDSIQFDVENVLKNIHRNYLESGIPEVELGPYFTKNCDYLYFPFECVVSYDSSSESYFYVYDFKEVKK